LNPHALFGHQALNLQKAVPSGCSGSIAAAVKLLAALDHTHGVVLAQRDVDAASNEISAFGPLLEGLDLAWVIVTADALHTQRAHASLLVS
jgi:hypothetical protein